MENQIVLDSSRNEKLMISFAYKEEEFEYQAVNDDVFYAEEIELQETIIDSTPPSTYFQNVQGEVTIKNETLETDDTYQEVFQSLIPLSENNEVSLLYKLIKNIIRVASNKTFVRVW